MNDAKTDNKDINHERKSKRIRPKAKKTAKGHKLGLRTIVFTLPGKVLQKAKITAHAAIFSMIQVSGDLTTNDGDPGSGDPAFGDRPTNGRILAFLGSRRSTIRSSAGSYVSKIQVPGRPTNRRPGSWFR